MKSLTYFFITISVIFLAFWAYQESFKAKSTLTLIKTLNRDINHAQENLSVLRAEWAYLNRPDRLRALADLNFEELGLIELNTKHFGYLTNLGLEKKDKSQNVQIFLNETKYGSDKTKLKK